MQHLSVINKKRVRILDHGKVYYGQYISNIDSILIVQVKAERSTRQYQIREYLPCSEKTKGKKDIQNYRASWIE